MITIIDAFENQDSIASRHPMQFLAQSIKDEFENFYKEVGMIDFPEHDLDRAISSLIQYLKR